MQQLARPGVAFTLRIGESDIFEHFIVLLRGKVADWL